MDHRLQSIDAIRTIDNILYSSKSTVSSSGYRYVKPVKSTQKIDQKFDFLHKKPDKKQLAKWVEEANEVMLGVNAQLAFRLHEGTGRTLVQLVEKDTKEVLREIPPEKMLDVIAGIWEWAGIAIDRTE